jgi:hypothetical protein
MAASSYWTGESERGNGEERTAGGEVEYEDPDGLLRRLALGREEFCQRLLTMLILGGAYPRWNSRNSPTAAGVAFLRALDELSFSASRCVEPIVFVDELELQPRHELERGGAPDYAVLGEDRAWFIELKTEVASHRVDQLPGYYTLGGHHFPGADIDITYVTPTMTKAPPTTHAGQRYAHVTWQQVEPLVREIWPDSDDERVLRVRDGLLAALAELHVPWRDWRAQRLGTGAAAPTIGPSPYELGLAEAQQTAADGGQRAVPAAVEDLQALHDLRVELRDRLAQDPETANVRPWVWNAATSGGTALTPGGEEHGFELRLSRYKAPATPA